MQNSILYSPESIAKLNKRIIVSSLLVSLFAVLMVVETVVLCFFISDETVVWITVSLSFSLVLFSWAIVYLVTAYIVVSLARKRLIKGFQGSEGKKYRGKIISASKIRTPMKFIQAYAVELDTDEGIRNFYYDAALGEPPFKEGDDVSFLIKSNFICEVDADHE